MKQSRFLVSAAHKSSGKTTLSIALCAIMKDQGLKVQSFKKGPDYIDPMWLAGATARPSYNLDFNTQSEKEITAMFASKGVAADVVLVEGNKGLYDGVDPMGSDCNAALAKQLDLPVVLVIDCKGITRGVAPLLLGYQQFDPQVRIVGVVLNKVRRGRHESKLRATIEHYTDIPVLGAVAFDRSMEIKERHLGLIPSNEHDAPEKHITRLAAMVRGQVDIERLLQLTQQQQLPVAANQNEHSVAAGLRIGVFRDRAFGFYYADDLEQFGVQGCELLDINSMTDETLPDMDGLFIGGGFPESYACEIGANKPLREAVRGFVENGGPCYAECGGFMYLSRSISWQQEKSPMVGIIPTDTVINESPVGRGYVRLKRLEQHLWNSDQNLPKADIRAHEFHYASSTGLPEDSAYAYHVGRGHGIDGNVDGWQSLNLLAGFAHLRDTQQFPWIRHFASFVRRHKSIGAKA